jgi:hypothetical protein
MKAKKQDRTGSLLTRQVASAYKAFLARRGMKAPGKWKSGFGCTTTRHAVTESEAPEESVRPAS